MCAILVLVCAVLVFVLHEDLKMASNKRRLEFEDISSVTEETDSASVTCMALLLTSEEVYERIQLFQLL